MLYEKLEKAPSVSYDAVRRVCSRYKQITQAWPVGGRARGLFLDAALDLDRGAAADLLSFQHAWLSDIGPHEHVEVLSHYGTLMAVQIASAVLVVVARSMDTLASLTSLTEQATHSKTILTQAAALSHQPEHVRFAQDLKETLSKELHGLRFLKDREPIRVTGRVVLGICKNGDPKNPDFLHKSHQEIRAGVTFQNRKTNKFLAETGGKISLEDSSTAAHWHVDSDFRIFTADGKSFLFDKKGEVALVTQGYPNFQLAAVSGGASDAITIRAGDGFLSVNAQGKAVFARVTGTPAEDSQWLIVPFA